MDSEDGSTSETSSVLLSSGRVIDDDEIRPLRDSINKKQQRSGFVAKLYVVTFVFIVFVGAALMSCVAPFFPTRAMQKGVSQTLVGIIIGSGPIAGFITCLILSVTMFRIGIKFLLCSGMFVAAASAILFGVIDFSPPGLYFPVFSFIIRVYEGVGISMYFASSYTMSALLFADNYAFVMGLLETATSLGTLLGPSLGGALYAAGGYFLPFAVLGGVLLLLDPFAIFLIPSDIADKVDPNSNEHNPFRVLRKMANPTVLITAYTMLAATVSAIFTETTLGVRLEAFGVTNPLIVGAIYLASSGAYAISAPLTGRIADKYSNRAWVVIFIGTVLLVVGYLILGPSPILFTMFIPEGLPQLIIGCLCTHTGLAAVVVSTTKALQSQAEQTGLDPNSIGTLAFITSIFQSVWHIGGFLGSIISSALMDHLGYGWATTIQSGLVLTSLLLQIYAIFRDPEIKCCCRCLRSDRKDYEVVA